MAQKAHIELDYKNIKQEIRPLECKNLLQMENKPEPKVSGLSNKAECGTNVVFAHFKVISDFCKVFAVICLLKQICTSNSKFEVSLC